MEHLKPESTPKSRLLAVCIAAMLVLTACQSTVSTETTGGSTATTDGSATSETTASSETPGGEPDSGEETEVVIALTEDVAKIDPMDGAGWHEWQVGFEIADNLYERQADGSAIPALATDMELSEDEMTWTVHLRDDVFFHNGDQMTAEDLIFVVDRAKEVPGAVSTYLGLVESAEAIDELTVQLNMSSPDPLLRNNATRVPVLPASYIEEVGIEEYIQAPVGTGPYQFVEWVPGDRITLEAYDNYWRGRPEIDRLTFRVIPEESAQVAALLTGEVDITQAISPESSEQILASGGEVATTGILNRNRLMIDTSVPPLDIKEVRQAINYALDVPLICDVLLSGFCTQIPVGFHPAEAGYLDIDPYPHDPDRARELLAEAGFPDGLTEPLTLSVDMRELAAEDVGTAMAEMLGEVGIPIELELQSPEDFREAVTPPKTNGPLLFTSHSAGGLFHVSNNFDNIYACDGNERHSGYSCFPEVDDLKNEAKAIWAADEERAIELYQEAQEILFEEAPAGWLYYNNNTYGVSSDLEWTPGPHEMYQVRNMSKG